MTTREAVAAFDLRQIYISSLLDLAPQHALKLDSIRLAVVAYSVRHTTVQKTGEFYFEYWSLNLMTVFLNMLICFTGGQ